MSNAISIQTNPIRLNIKYVVILLAATVAFFVLSNYFTAKHIVENTTSLKIENITGIAEEIYTTGSLEGVKSLAIDAALTQKLCGELERILSKTIDYPGCEVYFLQARRNGNFPVLGYGDEVIGYQHLKINEVWKVGMTGNGEDGRYPGDNFYKSTKNDISLTREELRYQLVFEGTYKHALVLERVLIYTYGFWSGHPDLIKPPGCKIFR